MDKKMEYSIYRRNPFNDNILSDLVGKFSDLELARDFIEYQASLCNSFCIIRDGVVVYE